MIAKRVVALVLMAMVSTVSPAIYQKGLEPRLGALDAKISVNSFTYEAARSGRDVLCYKAWITVQNPNPYEVILSQLDLDMFFATNYTREYDGETQERFKKIGSFNTTQEFTVPASKGVDVPENEWGAIASFDASSHKIYGDPLWGTVSETSGGTWTEQPVYAYIYFSTQFEGNATEEAISSLLDHGTITVSLQGDLVIGPLKIPFSIDDIELGLNIKDKIFTIVDVVGAYKSTVGTSVAANDIYYIQAVIRNPSGNPFILKNYRFDLYKSGESTPIALGIDSRSLDEEDDPDAMIFDPDVNQTKVGSSFSTRVPLRDIAWGTYDDITKTWARSGSPGVAFAEGEDEQYIIFGLNFTTNSLNVGQTKDNIAEFIDRLLNEGKITDLELKGYGTVALGTIGETGTVNGIEVNYGSPRDWKTDPERFTPLANHTLAFTDLNLYQLDMDAAINIMDQMVLGAFTVTKIDVNKNSNQITLNASCTVNFTNPYRIEMDFTEFDTAIDYDDGTEIDESHRFSSGTENRDMQIWRAYRTMVNPTRLPQANVTAIQTNVTIGYNTNDYNGSSGLGQIYKDIGFWQNGSLQIFNLTNPFHVLGPNGVLLEDEDGASPDWMEIVDYLISNNADPLMLLHEVDTAYETHMGTGAYMALNCSTFGTEMFTGSNPIVPAEDFPSTNSHLGGDQNFGKSYHTPFMFRSDAPYNHNTWDEYWNDEDNDPGAGDGDGLKKNDPVKNKYVFAATYGDTASDNEFNQGIGVPDWGTFMGAIWRKDNAINVSDASNGPSSSLAEFYPNLMTWRINTEDALYDGQFGYWYDFADAEKGYYLAMQDTGYVVARQNFTLPTWLNEPEVTNIKATLSMSYRYPNGDADTDMAVLSISNQSLRSGQKTYTYTNQLSGQSNFGDLDGGQYFWALDYPSSRDWTSTSYDVTNLIDTQLARMAIGGSTWINASKLEVVFGKSIGSGTGNTILFDDIILRIEYTNTTEQGTLSMSELFSYIEGNDPEEGNLYNMLDQMNLNATKFTAFLEGTLGHESAADAGIDFIDFMKQSGADSETMPDLLQNNYLDLGGAEPINFLQMLNQTKYRAALPQTLTYDHDVDTAYGARDYNLENWVVEDPMKASQVFTQKLLDTVYLEGDGSALEGDVRGEELWNMLENLEANLPWVCMYLIQHGWSKDDIFDLLEALGLGMETRTNIQDYNSAATGSLRVKAYMEIWLAITVIGLSMTFPISSMDDPIEANFKLDMGETLLDPVTDLYYLLGTAGTTQDVDGDGSTNLNEYFAIPLQKAGATMDDPVSAQEFSSNPYDPDDTFNIISDVHFSDSSQIGIKEYTLAIWINDKSAGSAYAPDTSAIITETGAGEDPYVVNGSGGGLTQAGCQQVFQNYRQNVKFQGETFLQTGGNPVSLFQFLDDRFFTKKNGVDYSSYTLLNYYDCKAVDFIEILTDYNRNTHTFDSLGNGICDEWKASNVSRYWEGSSTHYDNTLSGFGTSFRDTRIFKPGSETLYDGNANLLNYVRDRTNTIIWTDSPDLCITEDDAGDAHEVGNLYLNENDYGNKDDFEEGAPQIVNLLDMFAWLSLVTGKPDPEQLMSWLTGQLSDEYYDCIGNGQSAKPDALVAPQKGLGPDGTWNLFKNITMNATGMVNWLENVRHVSPFKFFYLMNQTDQAMDPLQLIYYATNENWVLGPDGSISYVFHNALGTTNAIGDNNLWKLFNSTWWAENDPYGVDPMFNLDGPTYATLPHLFYQALRDLEVDDINPNEAYNLMVMMETLGIDPVSWVNVLQWRYNIRPLELYAIYNTLNYEWAILNRTGGRARIRVNGNISLQVNGLNLDAGIDSFAWEQLDRELTADYHLRYFLVAASLYQNSYVYHS